MQKKERILEIYYRLMRGEHISVKNMAEEFDVSSKSISRDINEIKSFLSEARELVGDAEIKYAASTKSYYLELEDFLLSKELVAVTKILIGCRAFSKLELLGLVSKLKSFTTYHDKRLIENMITKEIYHYNEVKHDCKSVIDTIWKIMCCISGRKEITISYYKQTRELVERRIIPVTFIFSDYYFYLIAYRCDKEEKIPLYYRADRIVNIVEHRKRFLLEKKYDFDEGDLHNKIQFMEAGEYRKIKFSYSGPSVQAVLDRIPTAKVIDVKGNKKIITAETFGTGINRFLLSQGCMVEVLEPAELVSEIAQEIKKMGELYR